jgi:DNA-binding IclR family transcriptional regulator
MFVCIGLQLAGPGLAAAAFDNRGLGFRLFQLHSGVLTAWGAYEALRAWARLRRRERVGLADPVVCERVLLWGIASVASAIVGGTSTVAGFLGINFAATAFGAAVIAPLGLTAAGAMWLAFLPPAAYLGRVRARALPAAVASGSAVA